MKIKFKLPFGIKITYIIEVPKKKMFVKYYKSQLIDSFDIDYAWYYDSTYE